MSNLFARSTELVGAPTPIIKPIFVLKLFELTQNLGVQNML